MSKDTAIDILFPPGRMVQGNLYKPNTTDAENRPLVVKSGPNAGQPRVDYFFAVAIPKGTEGHWANTEWGQKIWNMAHTAWPQGQAQRPDFAWKIVDGDSTIPNKRGVRPCDMVGHAGHWVLKFGGGYAPKIVTRDGSAAILEPDAVKPGYFVQVFGNASSNQSTQTAGIYLNHRIVALAGYGEEISFGPDPTQVGFGGAALPAGASATPLGGMTPPAAGSPPPPPGAPSAVPGVASPPVPGAVASPPPVPGAVAAAPAPTPPPNAAFVAGPAATPPPVPGAVAAAPPPPVAAPPAPAARAMTAAATTTYEGYIAAGWNDAQLIAHGLMTA
jgi:hypothetical protein